MSKYKEQQQFEDYLKANKNKNEIKKLIEQLKESITFLEKRILFYM
tara:strand:+ start:1707 stop:1844 length:138 start_codon:yes stop_codon:yes gene_type:complete